MNWHHFAETKYGFEWGAAHIQRAFSDSKKGWVTLTLDTPKHTGAEGLQIYVTRTGKVRISDARGEWMPPHNMVSNNTPQPPQPETNAERKSE